MLCTKEQIFDVPQESLITRYVYNVAFVCHLLYQQPQLILSILILIQVLAKLVCGINKPNKQTVLPHASVPDLWSRTKVGKVRGLGGKLGDFVESLGCVHMSDLRKLTEKELSAALGSKTG